MRAKVGIGLPLVFLTIGVCFPISAFASVCASDSLSHDDADSFGWTSQNDMAQPFTVSSNCVLGGASVYLNAPHNSPSGGQLKVYTNSGGHPSALVESASFSGTSGLVSATFGGTNTLTVGTTYYLVMTASSLDGTNYYIGSLHHSNGTYGAYQYCSTISACTANNNYSVAQWEIDAASGGGGGGGSATSSTSTNPLGTVFSVSFLWMAIMLCELFLIFIPIFAFAWAWRMFTRGYHV